jgi:Ala-tRNA(Pro) deacylase
MEISNTFFTSLSERGDCDEAQAACLRYLDAIGMPYEGLTHDPGDTIALCEEIEKKLGAPIVKNLFLCNQQKTAFYLLIMPGPKVFKTKYLSKQIGSARLSFADADAMKEYLGVTPGSVSIFGLINDKEKNVRLIFDREILNEPVLGFHPCKNTATLKVTLRDLNEIFLPAVGYAPTVVDLPAE